MNDTEQIGPRISKSLKDAFERHLEREGGFTRSKGSEVEVGIELALAHYYMTHKQARADVPKKDRQVINEAIEKHSYKIKRSREMLKQTDPAALEPINWDVDGTMEVTLNVSDLDQEQKQDFISELEDKAIELEEKMVEDEDNDDDGEEKVTPT